MGLVVGGGRKPKMCAAIAYSYCCQALLGSMADGHSAISVGLATSVGIAAGYLLYNWQHSGTAPNVAFFTDVEGNWDYFLKCVEFRFA